jgi:hypothetical protein
MLDIAPHQYLEHTLASGDTIRGISWTDQKFVPRTISFSHDPSTGIFSVDVSAEMETDNTGVVSVNGDVPSSPPDAGPPPSSPPAWNPLPTDPDLGTGEVLGVAGEGGFFWTSEALGVSPTYAAYNTGIGDSSYISSLCNDPKLPYRAACIDNNGDVHVTTNWRAGSAWTSSLTVTEADTLVEAKVGGTVTGLKITCVKAFAKSTDETGTLLAVVQFNWDETTGENAPQLMKTRVLRSTDWGTTWACGGEIPGLTYLAFVYKSWTLEAKLVADTNHGEGDLAWDGTNLIIAARTMRNNSIAVSALSYSSDWGENWLSAPVEGFGGTGTPAEGVTAADVDSNGKLYMVWWKTIAGSPDVHDLVSTTNLGGSIDIVKALTDGDDYANRRDMFKIMLDNGWVALFEDAGDTKVEVNGSLQSTLSSDVYRFVHGFEKNEDILYVGRSYITGEKASGGDEDLLRVSQNQAVSFAADGTNLYALGLRGVTGIITDWSND